MLDFGTASTDMLALLGQSRTRAEIVDLAHFGAIERLNTTELGPELAAVANSLLPSRRPDDAIDLVFCWDFLNYLNLDALCTLMGAIGHRARPGAFVHALIYYAERDMPEHPGRYVPTATGELVNLGEPGPKVPAPRYSPEELGRGMRPFVIDRARLLGNGMQEFLFQLAY